MATHGRRRALGQHFLRDTQVIHTIVSSAIDQAKQTGAKGLFEIGPGKGALTKELLLHRESFERFFVCERDPYLVQFWKEECPSLEVLDGDFLDLAPPAWKSPLPLAVVSNLPYSAGTAIFTRLAEHPQDISSMTLMFQAEVAARLRAEPNTKAWGSLSVWTQNLWDITKLLAVSPRAFSPPPDVQSEVIQCLPRATPRIEGTQTEAGSSLWNGLLRACFAHRRKMLRSCLDGQWKEILLASPVDPTRRAEALTWDDWKSLFDVAKKITGNALLFFAALGGLAIVTTFTNSTAHASVGDTFGYGSYSTSLGGATVAVPTGGFSAYSNPATLSRSAQTSLSRSDSRLALSWALLGMQPDFLPIDGITLTNDTTAGQTKVGSVDFSDHKATLGQALGLTYLFSASDHLALGLLFYMPVQQFARVDTGEVFAPQYPLYLSRTQRPQMEFALSGEILPQLYLGAGLHLSLSLTSSVDLLMETNANKPSSMRFVSSISPKANPTLGLYWNQSTLSSGLVYRFAALSPSKMTLNSTFKPGFAPSGVDFRASANSALFYDPASLEWGFSWKAHPLWTLYAQLDYQRWSAFEPSLIQIEGLPDGAAIQPSKNPSFTYQDILVPRLGQELELNASTLIRLGYSYHPSILSAPPTGDGNLLDPPKHEWNAGVGLKFQHFLHTKTPCELDFHASYHSLVTQHIAKTTATDVGGPSYDAGGKIYGGGVSLSLAL